MEEDGAWVAEDGKEIDLFEEVVEAMDGEDRMDTMVEDFEDASNEAFIVTKAVESGGTAELYDSGCTNHIVINLKTLNELPSIIQGSKQTKL